MAVLSRFIYSLSESGELRWVLLPRRRSVSPSTQAGDGTWFILFRVRAVRVFKGCRLWLQDGSFSVRPLSKTPLLGPSPLCSV